MLLRLVGLQLLPRLRRLLPHVLKVATHMLGSGGGLVNAPGKAWELVQNIALVKDTDL